MATARHGLLLSGYAIQLDDGNGGSGGAGGEGSVGGLPGQSLETGAHQHWRLPLWMAGGSNFAFKTGRLINLPHTSLMGTAAQSGKWVVHNRLLTSICQAFGMTVDSFGTLDPGKGGVAELA